jgi:hypothetical protein
MEAVIAGRSVRAGLSIAFRRWLHGQLSGLLEAMWMNGSYYRDAENLARDLERAPAERREEMVLRSAARQRRLV